MLIYNFYNLNRIKLKIKLKFKITIKLKIVNVYIFLFVRTCKILKYIIYIKHVEFYVLCIYNVYFSPSF
jgi:hypothetical protein